MQTLKIGEWTCQVTPSEFDVDDGLASKSAKFVVRNPPDDPRIYFEGRSLDLQVLKINYCSNNCNFDI